MQGDAQAAARAHLEYAEEHYKWIEKQYQSGRVNPDAYEKAKLARDLARLIMKEQAEERKAVEKIAESAQPQQVRHGVADLREEELKKPPELRFLAWQDENKEWPSGWIWRADGTPVAEPSELRLLTNVWPTRCGVENNPELVKENPRFLHLWFSHPGIDKQSVAEVALLDSERKPLPSAAGGMRGSASIAPEPNNDHLGWIVYTLSPGVVDNTPDAATIRLQYSAGPWEQGSRIAPDYRGVMSLPGGATLSGIGQNAAGKAFISVAKDMVRDSATQLSFTATAKDGRELDNPNRTWGGPAAGPVQMEQFEFDAPLDQIESFRLRTRPIRTVEFKNVSLRPGEKSDAKVVPE